MNNIDIAFEDTNWLNLRATSNVSAAFDKLNVFFGYLQRLPENSERIIKIPKSVTFEEYTSFMADEIYEIGAFTYSESHNLNIRAGRYCSIAGGLRVMGERHPYERVTSSSFTYAFRPEWNKPQFIRAQNTLLGGIQSPDFPTDQQSDIPVLENDVWIGQDVLLSRGITLQNGCVIAAGAVVTKDVAPYTIVGGNPARVLKMRFSSEVCDRLSRTEWWNFHPQVLYDFGYNDPLSFLTRFELAKDNGTLNLLAIRRLSWKDIMAEITE